MRTITVFLGVALVYAFFFNVFIVFHLRAIHAAPRASASLPEPRHTPTKPNTTAPCSAWSHASLVLAPRETHPRTNDPSEAVRALAPTKRLVKRLASGAVYLAADTFSPAHSTWCERLQHETSTRVACHLLSTENATAAAAVAALQAVQPCLAAALVIEDPTAVDNGLLGRIAAVSTGHYACLAALKYRQTCPVYLLPLRT